MNDYYKVGIIIPAYNVEKYIYRAMESCINQTYKNIEIVVVDDGSSDGTYDVVKSYSDKDSRIKLYRQENGGVSSARNRALDMCTSDYVLFLDSDDWLKSDTVEKLVQKLEEGQSQRSLISSGCYYAYFDEKGDIYKTIPDNETENITMSAEEVILYVGQTKYNLRSSCYKLFSMAVIKQNHLKFEPAIRHGEDGLFVFEYLKNADQFVYFPDPLWNILERPGSATTSPYNSSFLSAITAIEKMMSYPNSEKLQGELRVFLVQRAMSVLEHALVADTAPQADIRFLRKKLRENFRAGIIEQRQIKAKVLYVLEAFAPKSLVAFLLKRR